MNKSLVLSLQDDDQDLIVFRSHHHLAVREVVGRLGLSPPQAYWLHDKALAHLAGLANEGKS